MLELQDVHVHFSGAHILQGVSLKAEKGKVTVLLGRNGMGKTTTVNCIMGLVSCSQGQIVYKGTDITHLPAHRIASHGIALVPQGRHIFSSLTVKENLLLAMRNRGGDERRRNVEKMFALFPVLKARENNRGHQLSGGEQQMLAIARALANNPSFLLMDEPSEGLAPLVVKQVGNIIQSVKDKGVSVLLVEQNFPMALAVADYIYIMEKGRIVYKSEASRLVDIEQLKSTYLFPEEVKTSLTTLNEKPAV